MNLPDYLTSAAGDTDARAEVLDERTVRVPHALPFGARRSTLVRQVAERVRGALGRDGAERFDEIEDEAMRAAPPTYIQNPSPYASHLIPPRALLAISKCLAQGVESHGAWNWKKGDIETHVGRGMTHAALALAGEGEGFEGRVEELTHLACRALFALELALEGGALRRNCTSDAIASPMRGDVATDSASGLAGDSGRTVGQRLREMGPLEP